MIITIKMYMHLSTLKHHRVYENRLAAQNAYYEFFKCDRKNKSNSQKEIHVPIYMYIV